MPPNAVSHRMIKTSDQFQKWQEVTQMLFQNLTEKKAPFWDWFMITHPGSSKKTKLLKTSQKIILICKESERESVT